MQSLPPCGVHCQLFGPRARFPAQNIMGSDLFSLVSRCQEREGDIIWNSETIRASNPNSLMLTNIISESVRPPGGGGVFKDDEPELFMWLLAREYHGSYAWCDPVVETAAR
jgi:hypothetical protein